MAASRSQVSRDRRCESALRADAGSAGQAGRLPSAMHRARLRQACGLGQIVVAGHRGSVNESDALASLLQQQVAWLARSARATQLPNLER